MFQFNAVAGASAVLLMRCHLVTGELVTRNTISRLQVLITGPEQTYETGSKAVTYSVDASTAETIAALVYSTMQGTSSSPDVRWPLPAAPTDDDGFNIEVVVPPSAFPRRGTYNVELRFTHIDGVNVTAVQGSGSVRSSFQ